MRGSEPGPRALTHQVHMVCPRLLELDSRHGEHRAGIKYPVAAEHWPVSYPDDMPAWVRVVFGLPPPRSGHEPGCACLVDAEGHSVATLLLPPGAEIADDHPDLICRCGRQLVVGQWISGQDLSAPG